MTFWIPIVIKQFSNVEYKVLTEVLIFPYLLRIHYYFHMQDNKNNRIH